MVQQNKSDDQLTEATRSFDIETNSCNSNYIMDSKNIGNLLASAESWSLSDVVDWLFNEGQQTIEPISFTDGLCRTLVDSGVPLLRLRIAFRTLHPLVAGCAFTWSQDLNATEFCLLHEDSGVENLSDKKFEQLVFGEDSDGITLELKSPAGKSNIISIFTRTEDGFSAEDKAKFNLLAEYLTPMINVIAMHRITEAVVDTYIGHRAGGKVLNGQIKRGDGETIDAVIWYCDLRDFTLLTETLAADQLLLMLNTYFEYISAAVNKRGGEVLRFIGDAMLIIFPVENNIDVQHTCNLALAAATEVLQNLDSLNQNRQQQHLDNPPIRFGIGLHIGHVIYGNVGAPDRLDFTVMGAAVNRTARLEELTKKVGVPMLLSAEFAAIIDNGVRSMGSYAVRGVAEKQEVFAHMPAEAPAGD